MKQRKVRAVPQITDLISSELDCDKQTRGQGGRVEKKNEGGSARITTIQRMETKWRAEARIRNTNTQVEDVLSEMFKIRKHTPQKDDGNFGKNVQQYEAH